MDDDVKIMFEELPHKYGKQVCVVCERELTLQHSKFRRRYEKSVLADETGGFPDRGWSDTCRSCEKEAAEIAAIEGEG